MSQLKVICALHIRLRLDHRLKRMRLKKGLPRLTSPKVMFRIFLATLKQFT